MNGSSRLRAAGEEPVDQHSDVFERETGCEEAAQRFLERVRAPYFAAGGLQPSERCACLSVRFSGFLSTTSERP